MGKFYLIPKFFFGGQSSDVKKSEIFFMTTKKAEIACTSLFQSLNELQNGAEMKKNQKKDLIFFQNITKNKSRTKFFVCTKIILCLFLKKE